MHHSLKILFVAMMIALSSVALADSKHREKPRYFDASKINWIPLLAPPPAADSAQQKRDLQAVLDTQALNKSGDRRDKAIADSEASCFRFSDVMGSWFTAKELPVTAVFLDRATSEINQATVTLKRYWQRPRPFVVSDKVERLADIAPRNDKQDAAAVHSFEYSSYPSGHATYGTACALLLTQLAPDKQVQLFQRATEYGESRVIVGAHFPSDLSAARVVATSAFSLMMQDHHFQKDLAAARKELQRAMLLETPPGRTAVTTRM